jgi:nitrate/nitrite transporter NarK
MLSKTLTQPCSVSLRILIGKIQQAFGVKQVVHVARLLMPMPCFLIALTL